MISRAQNCAGSSVAQALVCAAVCSFTSLRHLNVGSIIAVNNRACKLVISKLTGLRSLDISWCQKISNEGLGALSTLCELQKLNAGYLEKVTNEGIWELLRINPEAPEKTALPRLTELDLSWNMRLTDAFLPDLKVLTALKSLNLLACENISDRCGFVRLVRRCRASPGAEIEGTSGRRGLVPVSGSRPRRQLMM